ncbi:MAG: NAD-binding protein [Candidatus Bathyarchaeia archaeon]|nr:NAD-binding protein [Candidatus Bathyarchaeota archaeon]
MKKIVVFGAGNIGRSLVGQLFSKAGYEVVFVDVDEKIVEELNRRKRYKIVVKDKHPETIVVENVRAVNIVDFEKVINEILSADIMSTSVGVNNLQGIYPAIAAGIRERVNLGKGPIDIIICENIRNSPSLFREGLLKYLPQGFPLDSAVGFVETVIGKMVPIMSEDEKRKDPLLIYAEAYNKLVLDANAFKNSMPKVEGIEPKKNITAYVDQKLFVHNMGHSATAYLGYVTDPEMKYVWEAINDSRIRECVEKAMWESGRALILEYPDEFNEGNMKEHIENLVERFGNKTLGDTIYRVGRDLPRKLSRNDRFIGALLLDEKHNIDSPCTTIATAAAMLFRGKDEHEQLFSRDKEFAEKIFPLGIDFILKEICGLNETQDSNLISKIKKAYFRMMQNPGKWYTESF